jgi:hypothetical protein
MADSTDPTAAEAVPPRDLGPQPIADLMDERSLSSHDLVAASSEQINHKMVARARKGRRLTTNTAKKVLRAFNAAALTELELHDLFNYRP